MNRRAHLIAAAAALWLAAPAFGQTPADPAAAAGQPAYADQSPAGKDARISDTAQRVRIERVTTVAPFPRGLQLVDGELYVLSRGRVRSAGGVSAEVEDQAGTLWKVDPRIAQDVSAGEVSDAVKTNGVVVARPTDPPFRLWDRTSDPPESDVNTDRPYCVLRYHEGTRSFYVCAFSGIDMRREPGKPQFSKNATDALLRYDLRTGKWHEVERHDPSAGAAYPHADPATTPPPHGWLKGPDNCLIVGDQLYAVAKDNSVLVRYDLTPLKTDVDAFPRGSLVWGERVKVATPGGVEPQIRTMLGHSALAYRDGWLYVGYRTTSEIVRVRLDENDRVPADPVVEQVAQFEPYDAETGRTADLTDMDFDAKGRLYVISAEPARVFRFTPDPASVFDGRTALPWVDLAGRLGTPRTKSENILVDPEGRVYVTSGDGYAYQGGAAGTVYRISAEDSDTPAQP